MNVEADAVAALKEVKKNASKIAADFPALAPFLPLAGILLHAVHEVKESTGSDTAHAVGAVAQTLTPGLPNAPALTDQPDVNDDADALDAGDSDAAEDAADPNNSLTPAAAVQTIPDIQPAS